MNVTPVSFIPCDPTSDRRALIQLNVEYLDWVLSGYGQITRKSPRDMLGMDVAQYVDSTIDKVCAGSPPHGRFYLVEYDGALAGMGGLRRVKDGVAEAKRIYVRPAFRGKRLGERILRRVLEDATSFGFHTIVLDSAPFMQSAQRMYERHGFVDRPLYPEVEAPKEFHRLIRFMEKTL